MTGSEKIIVAMSGGVDSAVAALQLLRAGAQVEGLHMTNWEDDDRYCTAARDYQDARGVCAELGIPLHRVNFSSEYRERVFADFLAEYAAGRTPNGTLFRRFRGVRGLPHAGIREVGRNAARARNGNTRASARTLSSAPTF